MTAWFLPFAILAWAVVVTYLRYYRIWILYYVVATVGLVYWMALIAGNLLGLEPLLAHSIAWAVHLVSAALAIPTRIFTDAPGILLVLVVVQNIGWTVLQIGVESSGLLEISVLASVLIFYPGWSLYRRAWTILAGGTALWVANVIRLMIIVGMLNRFGKGSLVLAHTLVGRLIFFMLTILIFWNLITAPTLSDLRAKREASHRPAEPSG